MLKGIYYVLAIGVFAFSCSPAKRLTGKAGPSSDNKGEHYPASKGSLRSVPSEEDSKRVYKDVRHSTGKNAQALTDRNPFLNYSGNVENSSQLQFKYAVLTGMPVESLTNIDLLNFMEEWYGTPYRYGGSSKKGIDCSAFTLNLMNYVFGIFIPRTVNEQYHYTQRIDRSQLQLGDLVFFNMRGRISHVGVYLVNNKFVHASTSSGVMISDLGEDYFTRRYVGAGRPE